MTIQERSFAEQLFIDLLFDLFFINIYKPQ